MNEVLSFLLKGVITITLITIPVVIVGFNDKKEKYIEIGKKWKYKLESDDSGLTSGLTSGKRSKNKTKLPRPLPLLYHLKYSDDYELTPKDYIKCIDWVLTNIKPKDSIVITINSFGGNCIEFENIRMKLQQLVEKCKNNGGESTTLIPTHALSGGYYIGCVTDRVILGNFGLIGSIGVITKTINISKVLKKYDIDVLTFKSSEIKGGVDHFSEPTQEMLDHQKQITEKIFESFKRIIHDKRSNHASFNLDSVTTSDIWVGTDALGTGLVDQVANTYQILEEFKKNYVIVDILPKKKKSSLVESFSLFSTILNKTKMLL